MIVWQHKYLPHKKGTESIYSASLSVNPLPYWERTALRVNETLKKYNISLIYSSTFKSIILVFFFSHCWLTLAFLENLMDAEIHSPDILLRKDLLTQLTYERFFCRTAGRRKPPAVSPLGMKSAAESPKMCPKPFTDWSTLNDSWSRNM